jgi:hypothetical protein
MSAKVTYEDLVVGQKLARCGLISNRATGFGRFLSYGILLSIASQSLPTYRQLAVDAYHLTRQSGVQFRRIESQVETGRTSYEGLHV